MEYKLIQIRLNLIDAKKQEQSKKECLILNHGNRRGEEKVTSGVEFCCPECWSNMMFLTGLGTYWENGILKIKGTWQVGELNGSINGVWFCITCGCMWEIKVEKQC